MSAPRGIRVKKSKVEAELEKLRSEGCWNKAVEHISIYKNDSSLSYLYYLTMCESKLENYDQNYLTDEDVEYADRCLHEAIKTPDDQYKLEGLCIEELAQLTRRALTDEEKSEALSAYHQSSELSIRHFQELYQGNSELFNNVVSFPKVVFDGVQQMFILTQQSGNVSETVAKFRNLLRYTETPSTRTLRQWLSCKFAELLLRGVCSSTYQKYDITSEKTSTAQRQTLPFRYSVTRFVPDNLYSEAVLMLLISEHIASQEVILNRPSEASDARIMQSFNNTSAVYDLMAIALTRTGCYSFLSKTLEKSLKFSYREFHIWYQFALSLISARKYYRGYMVLRECLRLKPTKLPIFFLTTSLCLGQLGLIEDGLELACQAVEIATSQNDPIMCARAHLMLGWGCSLLARKCRIMDKKRQLQSQAISEYKKSTQLDFDDYLAWYHLSVELATQRQLDEALVACQNSLRLMPTHTNTLCLLALLHTAGGKRLDQASKVLRVGLADRPNDFRLLFLLAKVDTIRLNYKAGLLVYRRLLEVWRDMFAPESNTGFMERMNGSHDLSSTLMTTSDDIVPINAITTVVPTAETDQEFSLPTGLCGNNNHLLNALASFSNGLIGQSSASISPVPRSPSRSSNACTVSPQLQIQAKIYHGLGMYI
ncbi:Tetratricopeptide repeat protein 7B [Paragonimus westermani]|uniref:Tetratricopeptide repeat protein 7B n=1 Tax=Paragonimus westermani TaxID=34504 RepID=A0A8T0DXP7_9TREM|nr:Tetratricopeptide repeat protein 7B [Paragonimus westermani]